MSADDDPDDIPLHDVLAPIVDDAEADEGSPTRRRRWRQNPRMVLPRLVLDRALGPKLKRRLKGAVPLAIVVHAPGVDWCAPLTIAVRALPRSGTVWSRDGSKKLDHKPEIGNSGVANTLRAGQHAFGVSHVPERYLPSTLTTAADALVVAKAPDARLMRKLISACVGAAPSGIRDDVASGLGFEDIISAFRSGATGAQVIGFLATASSAKCRATATDDTPPLEELPGCDPAVREWGSALARGYAGWRAGAVPWREVEPLASVILSGPPGTGKTTIAKALARTLRLPLFATGVSEWFANSAGFLDSIVKRSTEIFQEARSAKGILFLDEIDAIPNRNTLSPRGKDWWTPVITHMLLLCDSAQTSREDSFCFPRRTWT